MDQVIGILFSILTLSLILDIWQTRRLTHNAKKHTFKPFHIGLYFLDSVILFFLGFYYEYTDDTPGWLPAPLFIVGTILLIVAVSQIKFGRKTNPDSDQTT
ncbi:MAG: hypothetical protein PHV74_13235 [Dehalococcoidia bacterium]|nr:hypothetical protein [Dehalococcoidia bacterium]